MGKFRGDFRGVVRVVFLTYQIFRHARKLLLRNTEHGTLGGCRSAPLVFNPVFYRFAVSRNAILNIFRLRRLRYHKVPETSPCG